MAEIIGVRFKPVGKTYYFNPLDCEVNVGDNVIVETSRGIEYGKVVVGRKTIEDEELKKPIKPIVRRATPEDEAQRQENKEKEKEAFDICVEKIKRHGLDMKLVEVEYTFDRSKVLFYFTADGRVDFRELVKDLAMVFRTRIELRQIGVRDESKAIGSIGVCGRSLCCSKFLGEFAHVSIKMAKEQGLSLNPTKMSGACGRLMCCLKYEQDTYEEILKRLPRQGALVKTPDGNGTVESVSVLKEKVKVTVGKEKERTIKEYDAKDLKVLKNPRNHEDDEFDDFDEYKD